MSIQKPVDAAWLAERERVYKNYDLYAGSDTADQAVFDAVTGDAEPRIARVVARLEAEVELPPTGRLLDVGCGRGAFLRAFGERFPGWTLAGCDQGEANRREIEAIPGVEFYTAEAPAEIPGEFDFIAMSHVLEHVPHPVAFLSGLRGALCNGGLMLVHGPNVADNPFDLLVVDHCTHFVPGTLSAVAEAAGYVMERVAEDWVAKELTMIARSAPPKSAQQIPIAAPADPEEALRSVVVMTAWLIEVAEAARMLAEEGRLGILGTAIAGVWLDAETGERAAFFCDEDTSRAGKELLGRPVILPAEVEAPADIYLPMPHAIAEQIAQRLARNGIRYHVPPAIH
jgi:SAM-dependent methyltransferase